jgi:hypothetical protein
MNETPTFMANFFPCVRKGWKLRGIVNYTAKQLGIEPYTIVGRPKTPTKFDYQHIRDPIRWLAAYFPLVFHAYVEGLSDKQLLHIWRSVDAKVGADVKMTREERNARQNERRRSASVRYVAARELSPESNWRIVK